MAKNDRGLRDALSEQRLDDVAERERIALAAFERGGAPTSPTGRIDLPEWGDGDAPSEGLHREGIRDFGFQLMGDVRKQGGKFAEWLDAFEFEIRFAPPDGPSLPIAPDSAFRVDFGKSQHWFLLEFEEPVDAEELRAKLAGYRDYYKSSEWRQQFPSEPTLLIVCTDDQVERRVVRALSRMPTAIPVFITTEHRYLYCEPTALGVMGRIWRVPRSGLGYAFKPPRELAER